ncbi:hypothetical protein BDA96_01G428600 [Sorghum bicolor]|uniref:Uncharacterized protein n=2 Tax=Sorghum bicolor TaxID=4558 RepID=A0A921S3L8_SORBI|nr:uncharacterized protein LOC110435917 [Sorghum bicolor]EER95010.2 hypothetical protein SORBI_3001G402800 [Sorghum bicolor]KAG0551492.1 hypothetical protein BDA96_01G428600 [Sorghum bicolor]|eukprot:XP_021317701.1 uncharacterized protein LOC110435917 [Sorghum bicolor]
MASAAILRSVARSLRLRQPLEQRCLMERRFLSSSVHKERYPSSGTHSREAMELKSRVSGKEDVYERLLVKIDKVSEGLDEHLRLLKQLEVQMKENKNGGVIDLTPWILSVPASLILFALYNYVQG